MQFILELFLEHIPAHFQKNLIDYYTTGYAKHINQGDCKIYCSSRRMTFYITSLPELVSCDAVLYKGPSDSFAKSSIQVGKFCKKIANEEQMEELQVLERLYISNDGYWEVTLQRPDKLMEEFLKSAFIDFFAKYLPENRMIWLEEKHTPFVRPVRNILAMLDGKCVNFELFLLKSCQHTYSNDYKAIELMYTNEYMPRISEYNIIIKYEDRLQAVRSYAMDLMHEKQQDTLDFKQEALLALIANHDEVIFPFHITINYEQFPFLLDLPLEFLYASLDDQKQTMPIYGERCNTHGEKAIDSLIFCSNIPVTERIINTTFKVCMSYLSDLHALYLKDVAMDFDINELKSLPMYKTGSMHDKYIRLLSCENILEEYAVIHWADVVKWFKIDLLSKSVQEFPRLQGVCAAFVLKGKISDEMLHIMASYALCANDKYAAINKLFCIDIDAKYGSEYIPHLIAHALIDIPVFDHDICTCTGMMLYWLDSIDTLIGFYIADIDHKIGSKDPFGLKQLLANIRFFGLMLYLYYKAHRKIFFDIKEIIYMLYAQYEKQKIIKHDKKELIIANILKALLGDVDVYYDRPGVLNALEHVIGMLDNALLITASKDQQKHEISASKQALSISELWFYKTASYWDRLSKAIILDHFVKTNNEGFETICSAYKRIGNFIKNQDLSHIDMNIQDDISVSMLKYITEAVSLQYLLNVSKELHSIFDANRMLDSQFTSSRLYVLNALKNFYDLYICFNERLIDVYDEKNLISILL